MKSQLSILMAGICLVTTSFAKVWYVSPGPTGNDGAAGTSSAPFATLQHAADATGAGDTVQVRAGNYVGFIMGWDNPQNGTPTHPIVFKADSGATIILRNNKTADGINLEGASYITVDGFTITNAGGTITRAGIRAVTDTGVVIRNNKVDGMGDWGIFTGFSERIIIENNMTSHSKAQHGIYFSNSADYPIIRGNISWGNSDGGIQLNADGSEGGDGIITGALVENNIIYNNGVSGGAALNCDGMQNSRVQNNLIYDNHASGIALFVQDANDASKNDTVVNNTIVMATDGRWAITINSGSTGAIVYNNIIYNNQSSRGSIAIDAASLTGFKSDYNAVMNRMSVDEDNSAITLTAWQSQTGQDLHSIIITPVQVFVDTGTQNFHLKAGAPVIDQGTSLYAPALDIEGNSRRQGSGYDIGAYGHAITGGVRALIANSSIGRNFPKSMFDLLRMADRGASVRVLDLQGKTMTTHLFSNGLAPAGTYLYSLSAEGKPLSGKMQFSGYARGHY
jgi:hypothetical protein